MGIERFFRSIEENKITNLKSEFTKTLEKRLNTKNLYIDFNSIIYITSFKVIGDLNWLLYQIIIGNTIGERVKKLVEDYDLEIELNEIKSLEYNQKISENLNLIILEKIKEYVYNILNNYVNPELLDFIMIAVDGVPTKSKVVEQRKRRYMGGIINKIDQMLFDKYGDDVKNDKNRWTFEQNKIIWDRANITPGTEFMDQLDEMITSTDFEVGVKNICQNLKKMIVSGPYEPGEGEKKIVDHIRSQKQEPSTYVIYSPDSDVTLLGLLLNTEFSDVDHRRVTKLKLLRHNQQKDNYDIVDIDALAENLYGYVKKKIGRKTGPEQDRVIKDIVLLLTIFGNDFLPKIEAFNVKYDFDRIIDKYVEALRTNLEGKPRKVYSEYNYLVDYDREKDRSIIDFPFLVDILKYLQLDEGGNLQKVYITQNYRNYDQLKKLLDADQTNFTQVMNDFLNKLQELNKEIEDNTISEKIVSKFTSGQYVEFTNRLTRLAVLQDVNDQKPKQFLQNYIKQYRTTGQLPKVRVVFRHYRRSLKEPFHQEKLENSVKKYDKSWKITKYDRESYLFQNMLEEYAEKLNAEPLDLGYVWVDPKTYSWKTEKIVEGVERYYDDFFGIKNIDTENEEMIRLLDAYLEGLTWVFEFYYNKFDATTNKRWADVWFYPHSKAPLLTQLYRYMKKMAHDDPEYLEKVSEKLRQYQVDRELYFNSLEHFMYVTPVRVHKDLVPEEYHKFIQKKEWFPDIMSYAQKVLKGDSKIINCRGAIFLNKCDMELGEWSWDKDQKFLTEIRKIKLSGTTKQRTGKLKESYLQEFNYVPFVGVDELVEKFQPFN